jgi:Carboxypeptidase regulatory-like domain/TonB-dependent Receptor Plug Domain
MYRNAALIVGLCLLFSCLGIAQTGGTISGSVSDSTGALIPGASVTIKNVDTGLARELVSDEQGRYSAPNLPVGPYEVQILLTGFRTEIRKGIELTVGQEAVVNLTLQVGQVAEQIEVTGEAAAVETTNATVSSLVNQDTIRNMPLNGRSFTDLIPLQVGTVLARNNTTTSALGGGAKISVTGSRPLTNNFLLDGTDIVDPRGTVPGGATGSSLGVDTVREFRVLTNGYSAEYGRASGGVFTAITRSGTNQLHGTAFEFLRNAHMDAAKWEDNKFGRQKPPFKRNQFGFTLGGPIQKNKTFFFGGYEGLRDRLGTTTVSYVPNALAHQGILPAGGAVGAPLGCPYRTVSTNPLTCAVAPGVQQWLNLFPVPNGRDLGNGTGEYAFVETQPTDEDYYTAKVDHAFSSKQSIFGRFTYDTSSVLTPGALPFLSTPITARQEYLTIQEDSVFSPTTLNTVRFGMVKSNPLEVYRASAIPAGTSFVPGESFSGNGGELNINGIATIGNYLDPRGQKYTNLEGSDDVTLIRGAHSLRIGAIFKRLMDYQQAVSAGGGFYTINGGVNDFLAGRSSSFTFQWPTTTSNRDWRQNLFGAYTQDDYKMRRNLTFNLGLREEFLTSPMETKGQCANLPSVTLNATIVGCPLFHTFKNNWAPRVGFAWNSMNNSKLVIRGGFGMFYDQPLPLYWVVPGRGVPPFVYQANITNATFPNAASGLDFSQPPSVLKAALRGFNSTGTPYVMQYNLNIQSQVSRDTAVTFGYLGSQSRKLIISAEQNLGQWLILPDGRQCYPSLTPGNPCFGPQTGVTNPHWGNITILSPSANASYNALVASVIQNLHSGLRVQAGYTFSKTISVSDTVFGADYSSDSTAGLTDPFNARYDRGLAGYNLKNSFNLNYTYDLPFKGQGWAGKTIGGWQMSGIIRSQSGIPFGVQTAANPGDGLTIGGFGGSPNYRPDLMPGKSNNPTSGTSIGCRTVAAGTPVGTPLHYFDPCVFTGPLPGVYGNAGRHTLIGPQYNDVDFSLLKSTAIREGQSLQFRAEFFNILNHPNFSNPAAMVFDARGNYLPTAGQITSTVGTSRQIQFGLKYIF